jgi:RNA polymerase sigma-70 factor
MEMHGSSGLAAAFLAHTKVRLVPAPDEAELELLLTRTWEDARAEWPNVALNPVPFVIHLAERMPSKTHAGPIGPLLESLALADLYLACACLQGSPSAIAAFDDHHLSKLRKLLRQRGLSAADQDEICQLTRLKVLVSTPEGPPKITEYTGGGSLLGWVRVVALRISTRQRDADKPGTEQDPADILDMLPEPGVAPEMDAIRRRHHADLRRAMSKAFGTLSSEARYLLHLYFVDKLSMYKLADLYNLSQPTISRRLAEARKQVYQETRRLLQQSLGLSPGELQSFMQLLDSHFDVRISKLLGQDSEEEDPEEEDPEEEDPEEEDPEEEDPEEEDPEEEDPEEEGPAEEDPPQKSN